MQYDPETSAGFYDVLARAAFQDLVVRNGLPGSTLPDFGRGTGIALECAEGIPGSLLHPRWFFTGQDGQERRSRAQRRKASSPMWCRFFLRPSAVGLPAPSDFMRLVTAVSPV